MRIQYIHSTEPDKIKYFDTEKAYKNMPFILSRPTLSEYEAIELNNFEKNKLSGIIKDYKIVRY